MDPINLLLQAVIEHPDADDPRLQYADALDERGSPGDAARAEHIRWACAHPQDSAVCLCSWGKHIRPCKACVGLGPPWPPSHDFEDNPYVANRGFICELRMTAAWFLELHEMLIWNPAQTTPNPKCATCGGTKADERGRWKDKHGHDFWVRCAACCGKEATPRPCPPTAHPIRKVVLTTRPPDGAVTDAWGDPMKTCEVLWPGIEFHLLATRRVADALVGTRREVVECAEDVREGDLLVADAQGRAVPLRRVAATIPRRIIGTALTDSRREETE